MIEMNRKGKVRRAVRRAKFRNEFKRAYALAARYAKHTGRTVFRDVHPGYAELCATIVVCGEDFENESPFGAGWNTLPDWGDFRKEVGLNA